MLSVGKIEKSYASTVRSSDKLSFQMQEISFGPGYAWGRGILHYRGVDYQISVSGGGAPAIGYSSLCANGTVSNLAVVDDFDSTFWAVGAEATAGSGSGAMALENGKGVEIRLSTSTQGVKLSAETSRLRFRLIGRSSESYDRARCK